MRARQNFSLKRCTTKQFALLCLALVCITLLHAPDFAHSMKDDFAHSIFIEPTCKFPRPKIDKELSAFHDTDAQFNACRNPVVAELDHNDRLVFLPDVCPGKENRFYTVGQSASARGNWKPYEDVPVDFGSETWATAVCTWPDGIPGVVDSRNLSTAQDLYKVNLSRVICTLYLHFLQCFLVCFVVPQLHRTTRFLPSPKNGRKTHSGESKAKPMF